jgi:NitT/TauT family transport system permease protein
MSELQQILQRVGAPLASVLGFFLLWQALVMFFHIPAWLLPSPVGIWIEFINHAHLLGRHFLATAEGAIGGLVIGSLAGLFLAIVMAHSRFLERALMPLIVIDQSIPKMALAPIFVIWFGAGLTTRIVIAMVVSFFPMVVNSLRGLTSVDHRVNDLMTTIAASRWQILTKVQLPNAVPFIFSALKVAVPLSIIGAVIAEFMQSDSGLGYLVLVAVGNVDTPMVFVAVLLMATLSLGLFAVLSAIEWVTVRRRFQHLVTQRER